MGSFIRRLIGLPRRFNLGQQCGSFVQGRRGAWGYARGRPGYAATYATPTFGQMWDNALGWFSGTPDSSSGYSPDSANLDALGFSITSNLYGIDYAFSSCGFGTDTSSYSDGSGDPSP